MRFSRSLRTATCLCVALGLHTSNVATAQTITPEQRATIKTRADSLVNAFLAASQAPAVSVAIVRGRDTLVMAGYGLADKATQRPATANTVYHIGSITKQFTAAAIMRLVDKQQLKLDDDISKYLPNVALHGHHVTVRQLLNHTSGIPSYTESKAWPAHWGEDLRPDSVVGFVRGDNFDFAPGNAFKYNNTGYVLLGMIVEKVSKQSYADYLRTEFFEPLGLRQTSYCPSHPTDPSFAVGYAKTPSGVAPAAYLSMTHPFAAGALCSTVRDMVRWQRALDGGRVVSAKSYHEMTTPDTLNDGTRMTYGFGLQPAVAFGHRLVAHDGGINGFLTTASYFPDDTLSVVVFSNYESQSPSPLALDLIRLAFGMAPLKIEPPPAAVALSPSDRDRVIGSYNIMLPTGATLPARIFVANETLVLQATGQGAIPLLHRGNLVFGVAFDPNLRVTFVADDSGKIVKMTLLQNGTLMDGPRVP